MFRTIARTQQGQGECAGFAGPPVTFGAKHTLLALALYSEHADLFVRLDRVLALVDDEDFGDVKRALPGGVLLELLAFDVGDRRWR
jgi:hypothetical protein